MDNVDPNTFLSIPQTALHQPHETLFTVILSQPSLHTALPDLENLFGDATFGGQSTTQGNFESSPGSTPTGTDGLPLTRQRHPSTAAPQETGTESKDDNLGAAYQGLPKDAKIGIIVGIVVIVLLSLLGCGMCFLDCRRRHRRRKERRDNRDSELMMLEMEMRNGQTEQQRRTRKGLWDHLKPANGDEDKLVANVTTADASEVTTKPDAPNVRKDSTIGTIGSTRNGSDAGWSPAYIPRDRASIVSSVPSLTSSASGRPALPRSFLDGGVRR
ncbi:hypothetical protein N0V90_002489 [Kalmusia sp. IMI 367209]|nr:hypothetical protein N0V90_002489 [Kalmusia sp. IMI 367209]